MAQITLSSRAVVTPWRSDKGDFRLQAFMPSTGVSTATIAYGDVVQFDVNTASNAHRIVKSTTGSTGASTSILGVAVEADSTAISQTIRNDKILVATAGPHTEFKFASKATGAQYLSTLVNTRRAVGYDSTLSIFYVDVANSTAGDAVVLITELINDEGTSNGFLAAKFISTNVARLISVAF
jgi:hypothetical protein